VAEAPLSGVRVLDAATLAAAPLAATYLAEFGAEVIKVEQPEGGDPIRSWGAQRNGVGLMWKSVGRNKKSITLDLRQAEGQDLFRRLAATCDVVVLNTRPHTLRTWGLDYDNLRSVNETLVVLHVTGFGLAGPKSNRPGFGTLGEAMSGFAHLTGEADGPPSLPRFMLADGVTSLTAAYAVMMALYHRDVHGGPGQLIDINLIDPLSRLMEDAVLTYDASGVVPKRSGNRWDISVPRNTYRTKDDCWIAMSGSAPSIALRAFRAIGRPELAEDPEFRDPQGRLRRADETDAAVAEWMATQTLDEAMAVLEREQVAAAPVYDVVQLLEDEHIHAREVFVRVRDVELTELRVQAPVPRFSDTPARIDHLGPSLGQHNDEIYRKLVGLSGEELCKLREAGVI
jgi:crotonobetainyl-CoA:carnitine CoA-transferase CaiB-like acyl-CoA transferase